MRRMVAGGAALALAGVGALALAGPSAAQELPPVEILDLEAVLDPTTTEPGGTVTATSVDPCPPLIDHPEFGVPAEQLAWAILDAGTFPGWEAILDFDSMDDMADEFGVLDEGITDLEEDGSWSVDLTAPTEPGDYEFIAICLPGEEVGDEFAPEDLSATDLDHTPEAPTITFGVYGPLGFSVETGETPPTTQPPTTPPEEAPPAVAVPGEPDFTG